MHDLILFPNHIYQSSSLCDDLSFIAEIGGYVGLFLGASVFQIADLFTPILTKLRSN